MRIAVTGGAGFLGAHLVRAALAEGHELRCLVRPESALRNLGGLDVEVVRGDLLDREGLPEGFPGREVDLVVHLAALYAEGPGARERMERVNVEGVRRVLEAALRDGVPRLLHCSTMGTSAPRPDGRPATEADRPDPARLSPYAVTKLAGEELALEERRLEVVVAQPSAPVGAFDLKPSVTGARIRDVVRGRYPRLLAGPVDHAPARGHAEGLLLAGIRGRPGERYLLGGEALGPDEFLDRVAAAAGSARPRRSLLERLRGKRRPTPGALEIDDAKAREELGYRPGPLEPALVEATAWFRAREEASSDD